MNKPGLLSEASAVAGQHLHTQLATHKRYLAVKQIAFRIKGNGWGQIYMLLLAE